MDQPPLSAGFPQPPLRPEVVPEPMALQPRRKSRVFVRLFIVFLFLGLVGSVVLNLLLLTAIGLTGLGDGDEEGRVQESFFCKTVPSENKTVTAATRWPSSRSRARSSAAKGSSNSRSTTPEKTSRTAT